ncbi:hypothetical protein GGR50DRAFT_694769 [Xylaria sp. CBS 124048]|nr:hypothetical protein GGR50DRAFT_694769 [Xylaria sp. CBS 124048]
MSQPPPTDIEIHPPRRTARGPTPTPPWWTKSRNMIWTGAFAAVIFTGTIYGAGLKVQREYHSEKEKVLEAPPEERIRALEAHRATLVTKRRPLESKLEELRLRIQKEEQEQQAQSSRNGRS